MVLEPIMENLKTSYWVNRHDEEDKAMFKNRVEDTLERTKVPVSAVVGKTSICVTDFVNLQRGDVLKLDSYFNSDLEIKVGSLLKFYAKPGTVRGRYAFQISKLIEKEE
jgi:flagellar motor switch protein FliM